MEYPYIGQVELFPYDFASPNYAPCHGGLLPISQNIQLMTLIGARFGGDGISTFALPDFTNGAPEGSQYYIALKGVMPPDNPVGGYYPGEIAMFAFDKLPPNWELCDGRELEVAQYKALFQIIGTSFGGDGETFFNLPDYRNHPPNGLNYAIAVTGTLLEWPQGAMEIDPIGKSRDEG